MQSMFVRLVASAWAISLLPWQSHQEFTQADVDSAARISLELNIPAARLDVFLSGNHVRSFPVSVGTRRYRTPTGKFSLTQIIWNPWWVPPPSAWARKEKVTPPGPENPMGKVKLLIGGALYLHATPSVSSIGHPASHGCVRMNPQDAVVLARFVQRETGANISDAETEQLVESWATTRAVGIPQQVAVNLSYELVEVRGDSIQVHPDIYSRGRPTAAKALSVIAAAGLDTVDIDKSYLTALLKRGRNGHVASALNELRKHD